MSKELSEIKVLELASVLAGPAVGMFFVEHGAQVIKIENKRTGGDVTRSWKLPSEEEGEISAYFSAVNWKKEHRFLDFTDALDKAILIRLLRETDIVITNFKHGDAIKFGLDHHSIKSINESIIIGEITGFGGEDDRVAYDLVLQAESGFMSMNGTPESGPVKMPVALIDILAAHQLKEGLLMALIHRKPDIAQVVSVSLYDSAIASLANQATNWLMAGHIPQRIGSLHPNIAPYGEIFTSKEGILLTLAIGSDVHFEKLCQSLGLDDLTNDDRFINNKTRVSNRKELAKIMSNKIAEFDGKQLTEMLRANRVPVAIIKDLKEVFEDPKAQSLILEEEVDGIQTKRVKTSVFEIKTI